MHGYLSSSKSFIYQTEFFKKDFNVFAFDMKGFGENQGMEYPYSLDDYIEEVKDFIKKNGLEKPHVLAHSFGGRIVLKLASLDKNIFDKIVLTGSAGLKPKRTIKYRIKKLIFNVLKLFVKRERLKGFYSKEYNSLSPVMKESYKKIVNEHLDYATYYIENTTLIINGKLDTETPPYTAKRLNKNIKNSRLIMLDGAGHFCFIDKPYTFNMEVREFLLSK